MTTGVALTVAGIVVANPIIAPHSDVQIPAIQLSAGTDPSGTGMLDAAFLNAIAPAPPESTTPLSVLKQLLTSLAADVTSFGRSALVDAFVAGVVTVTQPELTAASNPYVGPVVDHRGVEQVPATNVGTGPDRTAEALVATAADPTVIGGSLVPTVEQAAAALAADARFISGELAAAAFATGAFVASEPRLLYDTLRALVAGDIDGALQSAVKAVEAPLLPPAIVLDALRRVMERHLTRLFPPRAVRPYIPPAGPAPAGTVAGPAPTGSAAARPELAIPVLTTASRPGRKRPGAADTASPPAIRVVSPAAAVQPAVPGLADPGRTASPRTASRTATGSARGAIPAGTRADHLPGAGHGRSGHGRSAPAGS
jgi:hypothetical protein